MSTKLTKCENDLLRRVADIVETARGRVARTVHSAMVHAYWLIGREVVEVEQRGKSRAGYGDRLLSMLSAKLTALYGKGFSVQSLRRIRQFYLTYPDGSLLPIELGGPRQR